MKYSKTSKWYKKYHSLTRAGVDAIKEDILSEQSPECCCTCRFWYSEGKLSKKTNVRLKETPIVKSVSFGFRGQCRRRSPSLTSIFIDSLKQQRCTDEFFIFDHMEAMFPETRQHCWCGEYQRGLPKMKEFK